MQWEEYVQTIAPRAQKIFKEWKARYEKEP